MTEYVQIMSKKTGTFKFVFVPADTTEPLQELSQSYTEQEEVECLLNRLKVLAERTLILFSVGDFS